MKTLEDMRKEWADAVAPAAAAFIATRRDYVGDVRACACGKLTNIYRPQIIGGQLIARPHCGHWSRTR